MRHPAVLLALTLSAAAFPDVPAAKTHAVTLNGHPFTLPAGFAIELAAGAPQVDRPICADLDDDGRLFAADSSGSNEPVAVQLKQRPHRGAVSEAETVNAPGDQRGAWRVRPPAGGRPPRFDADSPSTSGSPSR